MLIDIIDVKYLGKYKLELTFENNVRISQNLNSENLINTAHTIVVCAIRWQKRMD